MKFYSVLGCVALTLCVEADAQAPIEAQIDVLMYGQFLQAQEAGRELLADSRFEYGVSRDSVVELLGEPGYKTTDGTGICYKTGAGPLWLEFDETGLTYKAIVRPPRWRGTDEELAAFWAETRETDDWFAW